MLNCVKNICKSKLKAICFLVSRNVKERHLSTAPGAVNKAAEDHHLLHLQGEWPQEEREAFMRIIPDFISAQEEDKLMIEVEPYMKRLHYEFDHWDDAIHGFRETERKHWYPLNRTVLDRVRDIAFGGVIMPFVHILDLADEGVIKPHVDSTRS